MDRRAFYLTISVVAAAALAGCAETGGSFYRPISRDDYPKPDPALGEKLGKGEIESTARIAAIIEAHLHNLYPRGTVYRDAHTKANGCVTARFTVDPGLGAPLNQGLFKTARSYDAVIRFSNSNEDRLRPDSEGDGRGMSVKVYGLSDTPLSQDPKGPPAQDFIMMTHPTFMVAEPTRYRSLIGYLDSKDNLTKRLKPGLTALSLGWTGTKNALAILSLQIDDPLNTRYWSVTPYELGNGPKAVAVKYSAAPCTPRAVGASTSTDPDFLRRAMAATLAPGGTGACMRMMVQPRTSAAMSVEDPRYEWPEAAAPFYQVATITIPPQTFDTPQLNRACEELSFSPWHALPDHRPLGAVNRMRKVIYERISAVRRRSPSLP